MKLKNFKNFILDSFLALAPSGCSISQYCRSWYTSVFGEGTVDLTRLVDTPQSGHETYGTSDIFITNSTNQKQKQSKKQPKKHAVSLAFVASLHAMTERFRNSIVPVPCNWRIELRVRSAEVERAMRATTDNISVPYALCLRGEAASRIGTTVVSVFVVVVPVVL